MYKRQRNSCDFTFTKTPRHKATNHRISNDVKQASDKDSLPEFSFDLEISQSSVEPSHGYVCSSTDFQPTTISSPDLRPPRISSPDLRPPRISNPDLRPPRISSPDLRPPRISSLNIICQQDNNLTREDHSRVDSSHSVANNVSSSHSRLESLLGKKRLQRLMNNLRDIDLASSPTRTHTDVRSAPKRPPHDLSQSVDQGHSKTRSTQYERSSCDLHKTSGSQGRRTGGHFQETKKHGVLERSSVKTKSSLIDNVKCDDGDSETEKDDEDDECISSLHR